jgi:serine/threonine protein kinase
MLGRSVGNYRLISKIGQGGMGVVYLAQHKTLGRRAAVKVLVPELSSNQDIVSRFFNEARATSAIRNPGIVEVFDFGFLDDRSAYIVMEYLDGESLAARIRKARPKVVATLGVLRAIARPLQAAHELGIVHRDLKPDNVFLVPDADLPSGERIKLLDFGIAKLNAIMGQTGHTKTGTVMGTPTYMAPEQCRGAGSVDHRADLYALGCIAYEMLCGQPPFVAEGAGEIIARHLYFEPAPPHTLRASLRPEVEQLVLRLLQKDPAGRPSTATEVIHVIDRLVANAPTVAPRIEPADPAVAVRRRRSEPLGMPAVVEGPRNEAAAPAVAAGRPRNESADPPIALRRRRDEPLAQTVPEGLPRRKPEEPPIALHRRREEPLAPTVPERRPRSEPANPAAADRRRSEPLEPVVAAARARSEPLDPPAAGGRLRGEPLDPPVASGRRRNEPLDPPAASGRPRNEPQAPPVASDRPSEPLGPPVASDQPRIKPADPPVAANRRRSESTDPLMASYRRLSESLDRPVASPRSAKMDTTLSGAVVSDVNTSAPTELRPRFVRSSLARAAGAAIITLLVVLTLIRVARPDRSSEEAAAQSSPRYDVGTVVVVGAPTRANPDPAGAQGTQPVPPALVPSAPAPVPSAPAPTPVAPAPMPGPLTVAPAPAPSPATEGAAAGSSGKPIDRPSGSPPIAKRVEGATPNDAGSASDKSPPATGHHKEPRLPKKTKQPDAKPVIPDAPASSRNHATPESSATPGESAPESSMTQGNPPLGAAPRNPAMVPLQLSCEVPENDAGPGKQLRIHCEATNPNASPAHILSVEVALGANLAKTATGPAWPEIPAQGRLPFEVSPTLRSDIKAGSLLPITITINTPDAPPAKRQIDVQIMP